jgi:hypothetical protein
MEKPGRNASNADWGRWLRPQPLSARVQWVQEHVLVNSRATFDIAKRLGFTKRQAKKLVEETIDRSDVSTVRDWLDFYAHVAGISGAIDLLEEWQSKGLEFRAQSAGYWLANLDMAQNEEARQLVDAYAQRDRARRSRKT